MTAGILARELGVKIRESTGKRLQGLVQSDAKGFTWL